jgi:hypothetical protein
MIIVTGSNTSRLSTTRMMMAITGGYPGDGRCLRASEQLQLRVYDVSQNTNPILEIYLFCPAGSMKMHTIDTTLIELHQFCSAALTNAVYCF